MRSLMRHQMRRAVEPRLVAARAQDRRQRGSSRAFAVGSGNQHAGKAPLRIAQRRTATRAHTPGRTCATASRQARARARRVAGRCFRSVMPEFQITTRRCLAVRRREGFLMCLGRIRYSTKVSLRFRANFVLAHHRSTIIVRLSGDSLVDDKQPIHGKLCSRQITLNLRIA